jgi:hypothetical protein
VKFKIQIEDRGNISTLFTIKRVLESGDTDIGSITINKPAAGYFIEELKKTDIELKLLKY